MAGSDIWKEERKFVLQNRLIDFTSNTLDIVQGLPNDKVGNHVAKQLLRSGSSSAPNYSEALSAESRRDFIHKIGVAVKELRETHVWLRLIKRRNLFPNSQFVEVSS